MQRRMQYSDWQTASETTTVSQNYVCRADKDVSEPGAADAAHNAPPPVANHSDGVVADAAVYSDWQTASEATTAKPHWP